MTDADRTNVLLAQADATRLPLRDQCVDMVFTSPPYADARTYGIGAQRECGEWVDWMLGVVGELTRVCRGLVLVNCAGVTRDWCYWPACEGLLWEWWRRGGQCWRPAYWHRVGIPGSGGKQWLRADVEYVLAFKRDRGPIPWADNTANGHPPKWGPGGEMSYCLSDGKRVNQWGPVGSRVGNGNRFKRGRQVNQWGHSFATGGAGGSDIDNPTCGPARPSHKCIDLGEFRRLHTKSLADGTDEVQCYVPPVKANPGTLVTGVQAGDGKMGTKLAHENEAPFPEALAEWFVKSWCPPDGIVLDPFSGSGTTVAVARRLGRRGLGFDLRMSQCQLGLRRLAEPARANKPKRARRPAARAEQGSLFTVVPAA